MLRWIYEIIYGAIADCFEMIGNMSAEVFDLEWVQATVKLFTLFGWGLFVAGTVVAVFDVAIEYQCGRANIKTFLPAPSSVLCRSNCINSASVCKTPFRTI